MHQDMISVAGGKYSWRKRIGSFMRKFKFSKKFDYIVCGLLATQHAHCHKEYYSPRTQAVSTSHVLGGDSRQRSQFAILRSISSQQRRIFSKFYDFRPAVNRQPMFPREMTRRADSACPPTNSLSEFPHLLQRTRCKKHAKT